MLIVVAVVFEVFPLPKFQNRFVIVPAEVSLKVTVSGGVPLVGAPLNNAIGGASVPQQVGETNAIESINQPVLPMLASHPARHFRRIGRAFAEEGKLTRVVMNPEELPVQACLVASWLAELF